MPLKIDYRPVIVPPPPPRAPRPGPARPSPARMARRIAGAVAFGLIPVLLPVLLALTGWGQWRGIAEAHGGTAAVVAAAHPAPLLPQGLHGDADPAPRMAGARPIGSIGTPVDHARALQCLTAAIYYEAAREPDEGQRAVAQVVLNRVAHPAFPKTVCGVVYQGSERPGCQFSFACDGSLAHAPMPAYWLRARRVAEAALAGETYAPVAYATHYHTSAVHPAWSDSMTLLTVIGAHRFYRWSGAAGQAMAFNAVYHGAEPIPAPHPRTWVSTGADFADPLILARAFEAGRLEALRRAALPAASLDPAVVRAGASFGQQPLPHGAMAAPAAATPAILPQSGAVRPEAQQQYDGAAHWIKQPGS